jgi:hypothetical protein
VPEIQFFFVKYGTYPEISRFFHPDQEEGWIQINLHIKNAEALNFLKERMEEEFEDQNVDIYFDFIFTKGKTWAESHFTKELFEKETKLPQELFDDIDRLEADDRMYKRCSNLYERYEFRKVEEIQNTMTPTQFARMALDMRDK